VRFANRFVKDTLGCNLLQFVVSYFVWILADHLHLSAVLCVISFAMTLARTNVDELDARMRVHSFAVWTSVVFTLNVFAFLLMGVQARSIIGRMQASHLREALGFASLVVVAVVLTRLIVVIGFSRLEAGWASAKGRPVPATVNQGLFVGWCGMRGFVTMAAAFALPESFPQHDTVVLTAFCVVLATLVLQGLTLRPLVTLLKLITVMRQPGNSPPLAASLRKLLSPASRERTERKQKISGSASPSKNAPAARSLAESRSHVYAN
jgi:monovalent cation/hydrogen antiporter